jgi:hypothetical protein
VAELLPTFFIIGAAKCGTTSLHEYLAGHPEVAMTTDKECMYFTGPDWEGKLRGYRGLFFEDARVRGESSTGYTAWPWYPEVPDRIRATVPDARMIYLVRDPIERTISHYAQNVWDGVAVRTWEQLMDDLEDGWNVPVWSSRYATQLERWRERFAAERILVLEAGDLRTRRAETLRRIFRFLEIDEDFVSPRWDDEHNAASSHLVPTALGRALGSAGRRWHERPVVGRLVAREVAAPTLTPQQRERLIAVLKPEADRLREMTGLSFAGWEV